ncbi:MAG: excinuclease ABC subunit UvrC [Pseudobdellovibrionaceae bacterium]
MPPLAVCGHANYLAGGTESNLANLNKTALEQGREVIRSVVKTLGERPGVYRMLSHAGEVLYVGKAKALKRRVNSYTQVDKLSNRIKRMVAETRAMEIIETRSEVEALLLEANLIKKFYPPFNVLLKDDKSYPYIHISDHPFPRLAKYRGSKKEGGEFFGPFASARAVSQTVDTLQRALLIRNCTDSYFANRKRPCLQYHIKRCTAPCVGYVDEAEYATQIQDAEDVLTGKSATVQKRLQAAMMKASDAMDYETAAQLRDRVKALSDILARQTINIGQIKDADVHAIIMDQGRACVQTFFFRGGQNFGNRAYFPVHSGEEGEDEILSAFLVQFYQNKSIPALILVNHTLSEADLIKGALSAQAGIKVDISKPARGARRSLVEFVQTNARQALLRKMTEAVNDKKNLDALAELFDLDEAPERIEVYDNSHISGTNMVGGMIVAGPDGFKKSAYRKFNIREAGASDDFAMMREVMRRRFGRLLKDEDDGDESNDWPDLVLIDGGKGQLSAVLETLSEMGLKDELNIVAISKGPDRNAGREEFHREGRAPFRLPPDTPMLHYLQRLRDEAHRFAIGAHRTRRKNDIGRSQLDRIPGIGPTRKKALLMHFGSVKAVERAGVEDMMAVEGISRQVAETIYGFFHGT